MSVRNERSAVPRARFAHLLTPSVHQHCHFQAPRWNLLRVCFSTRWQNTSRLGWSPQRRRPAGRRGLVERCVTRACARQTPTSACDQGQAAARRRWLRPLGSPWGVFDPGTATLSFPVLWDCSSPQHAVILYHWGFFPILIYTTLEQLHACNQAPKKLHGFTPLCWELHLPMILLMFSIPVPFTPLLLWLALLAHLLNFQ